VFYDREYNYNYYYIISFPSFIRKAFGLQHDRDTSDVSLVWHMISIMSKLSPLHFKEKIGKNLNAIDAEEQRYATST
jgi:hypothetical protein